MTEEEREAGMTEKAAPNWKVDLYDQSEMDAWSAAQKRSHELEEGRQHLLRTQHEDWLRLQDRSHEAWVEMNQRAVTAWERMAIALEALASRGPVND